MTIRERLEKEKDNLTKIILFYDRGLFYNCVEKSAYAFHTQIKPFKIHVKTLKGFEEPYISLGVPADKIDSYLQGYEFEKDENDNIIARLRKPIDTNVFLLWKQNMIAKHSDVKKDKEISNQKEDEIIISQCLHEIKTLNIASMTPMEAMNVLNNLHQRIKNISI